MAVLHNNYYASLSLYNPILMRVKNSHSDHGEFFGNPEYTRWLSETDPRKGLARISEPPIWVMHDEVNPEHGPLEHSMQFVSLAKENGNEPIFTQPHSTPLTWMQKTIRAQLEWASKAKRERTPEQFLITEAGRGPLSRQFTAPLLVVKGTRGTAADQDKIDSLVKGFVDTWKHSNHVNGIRVVPDSEVTEKDFASHVDILIGNEDTNSSWAKLASSFPISVKKNHVIYGIREFSEPEIGVHAWCNVAGRKLPIVLVGYSGNIPAGFQNLCPWIDGWYDVGVWSVGARSRRLIFSGRYD
jgi:hypothetical protein